MENQSQETVNDPRVILAAERTIMAWIRTGLSLMGFGFLLAKFGFFTKQIMLLQGGDSPISTGWSLGIGLSMILLGVLVNLLTALDHMFYYRQVRLDKERFRHGYHRALFTAWVLVAVGLTMAVYLAQM